MKINLFTSYYIDKHPARQKELDECLLTNVGLKEIDMVYVLTEEGIDADILKHNKIINVVLKARPTYNSFFEVIKMFSGDTDWNIIANSDIHFDSTITKVNQYKRTNKPVCFALTRWEVEKDRVFFLNRPDSQDTWIFQGKPARVQGDFYLGTCGCLTGDMIVKYNRGERSGVRDISIENLFKAYNKHSSVFKNELDTKLKSFDIKNKNVIYNTVTGVYYKGVKDIIRLTFENGKVLKLTADHKVLNHKSQFVEAGTISVGDELYGYDVIKRKKKNKTYKNREVVYVKHHPYTEIKTVRGYKYKRVKKYRLIYEASLNNLSYDKYIYIICNDKQAASKLKYISQDIEIHHIDGDTLNNSIENLVALNKADHAKIHLSTGNIYYPNKNKVSKIEMYGKEKVYDISMRSPNSNFLCNGIFVHNCDNAIADRFHNSGYHVMNPSKTIKTYHLHQSGVRRYNTENKVAQPYKILNPTI